MPLFIIKNLEEPLNKKESSFNQFDYSKFILEDFDAKDWINDLISLTIVPDDLERELTEIVIKLQFYMQEMNSIVDESTQNAFQSLPRIVREMESVRQEATILKEQMSLIKSDIEKVEKSTQDSMCKLLKIDSQKKKLSQIENSLQEADSWTQICDNIDNIMKSGDLNKIADKISSLQHSLAMLSSTHDYGEREKKIKHLCDNFEALLGPRLIQAFFNSDSEFIRMGLDLLNRIDRQECGSRYYTAWFKPSIEDLWNQLKANNQSEKSQDILKSFYDDLIKFCDLELQKSIFTNTRTVLISCLTESLIHLEDQYDQIIGKQYPGISNVQRRIEFLTNTIQITDEFCERLESILQANNSDNDVIDVNICRRLAETLYNPFQGVADIFIREIDSYLQNELNSMKMDSVDVSDSIDVLDASIDRVMDLARDSVKCCQSMTHFTSIIGLAGSIKVLFTNYVKEFKRVSTNIILKLSNQQIVSSDHRNDNVDNGIDDYYFLQDGIRLTSLGGHVSIQFESFMQEMLSQITNHINQLYSAQQKSNVFLRQYPIVLIESQASQNQVNYLWKQIINSDSQMQLLKLPEFSAIEETRQNIKFKLLTWLNKNVFDNAIDPVRKSLRDVHRLSVWPEELETGEALPQFAFSPLEYITKIGQFFMTLPQQLEPFFNSNDKYYQESITNGQLPHMSDAFFVGWVDNMHKSVKVDSTQCPTNIQVAHVWLESIVSGSLVQLLDQWLSIYKLSINGKHQLQADMNYIIGVVEDLDLQISEDLRMFSKLVIAVSKDDIAEIASAYNIPNKMVETVKKILF